MTARLAPAFCQGLSSHRASSRAGVRLTLCEHMDYHEEGADPEEIRNQVAIGRRERNTVDVRVNDYLVEGCIDAYPARTGPWAPWDTAFQIADRTTNQGLRPIQEGRNTRPPE